MSLRRNAVFGALGFLIPTAAALIAYPSVLRHLGASATGVYLLSTTLSGSIAFLEFGVSTAMVKLLAERIAAGERERAADVVATALVFYGGLGALGLAAMWIGAPLLARWAGVGPDLQPSAVTVFRIAAVQFIPAYLTGVLTSTFKGLQRYEFSTLVVAVLTTLGWGSAFVGARFLGLDVVGIAAAGLVASLLGGLFTAWLAFRSGKHAGIALLGGRPSRATLRSMLRFGVFMAVNGIAGVLMSQVQTWLIAALLGAAAVTVFTTALQITSKINALTGAMFEPLMPAAAALSHAKDPDQLRALRRAYNKALGASLLLSVGGAAVLYLIAPAFIRFWLHSSIDAEVVAVIRILVLGLAVNGATPAAYHLLNGIGHPETNTGFMISGIVLFYGFLLAFWLRGLDLTGFALATAASLFVNGVIYLVFAEMVVWRRWLPASWDRDSRAAAK